MAGSESIQKALTRVRPPRVKITYDVQIGDAIERRELPYIVGILADLSGDNPPATELRDRKFVEIDRDNFDEVLKAIAPTVHVSVTDSMSDAPAKPLPLTIAFETYDDFRPENLVANIDVLKALLDKRNTLRDLLTKADNNPSWAGLLDEAVKTNAAVLASPAVAKPLPKPNGAAPIIEATASEASPETPASA